MKNKNLRIIGQKYWKEAKKIIPGGTHLFSKNPDLYLPENWPAYFSRAKKMFHLGFREKKVYRFCYNGGWHKHFRLLK